MKTILIALVGFFALLTTARGQFPPLGSGLYRSDADFRQHRLALAVDCKTATHKLRLHEFSGKPTMTIIHGGKPDQNKLAAPGEPGRHCFAPSEQAHEPPK